MRQVYRDSLRDRIAVTIYGAASQWDAHPWDALAGHVKALYLGQADAVIAELGLRQECSWHVPVSKWAPHNPKHVRYVTDWKADNE
jgi:hypothetical protein